MSKDLLSTVAGGLLPDRAPPPTVYASLPALTCRSFDDAEPHTGKIVRPVFPERVRNKAIGLA